MNKLNRFIILIPEFATGAEYSLLIPQALETQMSKDEVLKKMEDAYKVSTTVYLEGITITYGHRNETDSFEPFEVLTVDEYFAKYRNNILSEYEHDYE